MAQSLLVLFRNIARGFDGRNFPLGGEILVDGETVDKGWSRDKNKCYLHFTLYQTVILLADSFFKYRFSLLKN